MDRWACSRCVGDEPVRPRAPERPVEPKPTDQWSTSDFKSAIWFLVAIIIVLIIVLIGSIPEYDCSGFVDKATCDEFRFHHSD
jgi:hypothetical protein